MNKTKVYVASCSFKQHTRQNKQVQLAYIGSTNSSLKYYPSNICRCLKRITLSYINTCISCIYKNHATGFAKT